METANFETKHKEDINDSSHELVKDDQHINEYVADLASIDKGS